MKSKIVIKLTLVALLLFTVLSLFGQYRYNGFMMHKEVDALTLCRVLTVENLIIFACDGEVYTFYKTENLKFSANFLKYEAYVEVVDGSEWFVIHQGGTGWMFVTDLDTKRDATDLKILAN